YREPAYAWQPSVKAQRNVTCCHSIPEVRLREGRHCARSLSGLPVLHKVSTSRSTHAVSTTIWGGCMAEVFTRWIQADVTMLPRDDGRQQRPPCIFNGYHNSNLRFDQPRHGWLGNAGGTYVYLAGADPVQIGETGVVYIYVYGEDELNDELGV